MKISEITPSPKAQEYFRRIGFLFDNNMTEMEFLNKLQYAHVTTVPYENLDIIRNIPLKLDPESLFEKIVIKRRGGYCFELNGLFKWLLKDLGFEVHDYFARYLKGETGIPMRRHRILNVKGEEGIYVCDVGSASISPRHPLELKTGVVQQQFGESYIIEEDSVLGYVVSYKCGDEFEKLYSFTCDEQYDTDYISPSYYFENSSDSKFRLKEMVSIKTPNGKKVIDGRMFRVYDDKQMDIPVASDEMMRDLLEIHYGIKL